MLKRAPEQFPEPMKERLEGVRFLEILAGEVLSALGISLVHLRYARTLEVPHGDPGADKLERQAWLALRREADSLDFSCAFAAPHVSLSNYTLALLVKENSGRRFAFAQPSEVRRCFLYEHLLRVFDRDGVACGTLALRTRELPLQVGTSSRAQSPGTEGVLLQLSTRVPLITSRHEIAAPLFALLSLGGSGCAQDAWRFPRQGSGQDSWCHPVMLNMATQAEKLICELVEERSVMNIADEKAFLTLDLGAIELSVDEFFALRTGSRLAFDIPTSSDVLLRYDGRPVAKAKLQMSDRRLSLQIVDVFALPVQKERHVSKSEQPGN